MLERAPMVAGMAISLADPGGPIEVLKESSATVKTIVEAAQNSSGVELVDALAISVAEKAKARKNPVGDFKPRGPDAGQQIVDDLREANRLVTEKATPDEAEAFREWLLEAARRTAEAAKEGGFMGFNAVRVSEGEEKMLERLREALSPAPG